MIIQSVIFPVFFGWAMWSFMHYATHRWWHVKLEHQKPTPSTEGEYLHHKVYDKRRKFYKLDTKHVFVSFPLRLIIPGMFVAFVLYAIITRDLAAATIFFFSMNFSMFIDDNVHKKIHGTSTAHYSHKKYPLYWKIRKMHEIHHHTHVHNYAFVTGAIWDVLFGTFSLKESDFKKHKDIDDIKEE